MIMRNLFVIAILGLILVFSAKAFGQGNKRKAKPKPVIGDILDGVGIRKKPASKTKVRNKIKNEQTNNSRKHPAKPVRNLEQPNGGMTTADETPEFGSNERAAKPKDLVKNKPEAKPALLEFQIPEKIVRDKKHPKVQNRWTTGSINTPRPKQYSLDGKGTDVNVDEVELRKWNPKQTAKSKAKSVVIKRKRN